MNIRQYLLRLDWSLYALRWLLVIGLAVLALLLPLLIGPAGDALRGGLLLAAGIGALLAAGSVVLVLRESGSRTPHIIGLIMDTLYALVVYIAAGGEPIVLAVVGMLPVVIGALRLGGVYGLAAAAVQAFAAPFLYALVIAPGQSIGEAVLGAGALLLLGAFVGLPVTLISLGWDGQRRTLALRERDAVRLRAAREHARAVYEMAGTLSSTLDYYEVLDAALKVGVLGLRELGPGRQMVSAVLLFDGDTGQLKVANAQGLTNADMRKLIPGRRGVLGLALQQAEPVFANDSRRDPELRYFVAFQDSRSILCVPLRANYDNYGVLVYGSTQPNAFSREHVELLTAIASQVTIALRNSSLYQDLKEERDRIIEVEEEARKQLSRDLHDGPTQQVAAIAMRVNFIRRLLERQPEDVPMELQKVEELARSTTKEIRHMLFTLRPLVLETQGLASAIHENAKKLLETYGQKVIVQVQDGIEDYIEPSDQSVYFNIIDEAVNNARKHAEAEHIWVRFARRDDFLLLEIEDDGVGFDIGEVDANYDQRGSLGMINLRERTELVDGNLRIDSAEGKGTKITVVAKIRQSVVDAMRQDTRPTPPVGQGQLAERLRQQKQK